MNLNPHYFLLMRYVIIFFIIIKGTFAKGQFIKYDFDTYNTKDGLSQNNILTIAQDKKGFMWFGTEDGLNRFDGHEFKIFKHQENNPNSIISNSINALLVDDDSSIWIGTNNGLCRYFPDTEFIQHFPIDYTDVNKLNGGHITSITKDDLGKIWITYIGSGIDIIIPNEEEIFHYTVHRDDEYKLNNDLITCLQFMPDGYKIIGTFDGMQVIDNKGVVLSNFEAAVKYPWINLLNGSIQAIHYDEKENQIWIGTETDGLYQIEIQNNTLRNFNRENSELETNQILSIVEDSKGNIWVGSDALYQYTKETNKLVWYTQHGMFIRNHTKAIYEDKNNNLWIGTSRLGILKYNPTDTKIFHYHSNQGAGCIKSDEILSFNEDDNGNIWVGTGGAGLNLMKKNNKGFEQPPLNSKFFSQTIKCIYKDKEGYFWMGTWDGGMIKYHPIDQTLEQYHPNNHNFKSRHVWSITGDKHGDLWLGTLRDGLIKFSPKTKKSISYTYIPNDTTALLNNDVLALFIDSREILWVGTANGISVLLPGSDKFKNRLKFKNNQNNVLPNIVILTIFEDKNGKIWLGTNGGGIVILDVKDNQILVERILKETDGLPSNNITAIQSDEYNNLWISSLNGLVKINPNDFSVLETSQIASLQGTEFLAESKFKSSDGQMYFGGVNGFHKFHPDSLNINSKNIDVTFTSFKIFNEELIPNIIYGSRKILKKSITDAKEIILSNEDYSFTINFAPLLYSGQNSLRYAYYLENLDKDWQYTTADRRFLHYTNLSPGEYNLKVKASFDGKNWPEEATSLRIIISPPWWSTMWFKFVVFLIIASTFYSFFHIRVKFLKNQSRKLEGLVTLRTVELKNSNKEILSLLEEVANQKNNIENKNHELQEMNEELGAQRDSLELKGIELEKAQHKLKEVNTSLEVLVEKRTKILNDTLHELETFLYRASHDLQGPISTMKGLISLSYLENEAGITDKKYTDLYKAAVLKLEQALKNLMQKHTIQKANVSYEIFCKTSLTQYINELCTELSCFRKENFDLVVEEDLIFKSDRTLLSIIIINLLENSFLYSKKSPNPKVKMCFYQHEDYIKITLTDHGVGIKKDIKNKIFTMFFRGSELSTGSGLGLYLVKIAIDKLEGTIDLESEEEKYSKFSIQLPKIV